MKVLITGGAKRLGREMALAFAEKGASIVIHYNTSSVEARALVGEIEKKGCRAVAVQADVRNLAEVQDAVQKAAESLNGLDILVNNAAVFYKTSVDSATEKEWNELIDVNLRAPFFLAKFAAPFLRTGRPTLVGKNSPVKTGHPNTLPLGRIINIADTYGASPSAGFVPYGVSKAGLIAMTKGLAKELAPEVLVNCVCPGVIGQQVGRSTGRQVVEEGLCPLPDRATTEGRPYIFSEKAIQTTLLKHPVAVEDVVKTILFLAENNSMTGQVVFVDCGKNV